MALRAYQCELAHLVPPGLPASIAEQKIVLNMHCDFLVGYDHALVKRHLWHVDCAIECSDFIIDDIRSCFPRHAERCGTVYNGVDLEKFRPGHMAPSETLITVGRISSGKGLHVLPEAFAKVLQRRPNAQLEVIGRESWRSKRTAGTSAIHRFTPLSTIARTTCKGCGSRQANHAGARYSSWTHWRGRGFRGDARRDRPGAAVALGPSACPPGSDGMRHSCCRLAHGRAAGNCSGWRDRFFCEAGESGPACGSVAKAAQKSGTGMDTTGRHRAEMFSWEATADSLVSCYAKMADI